ncbi:MAG: cytochrome c [Halofilum sp. (in: g-proteobacteria)]|nr:cytochrome c [Halofilum sp. (in: g-proteobacteria)]
MSRIRTRVAPVALALALFAGGAWAQDAGKPKDLVEYRQAVMSSLGGHTGAIGRLVKGQVDADHLMPHAKAIAATAPVVDDIWWENSGFDDYDRTDALPEIWQQPEDFQAKIDDFQAAAEGLVEAVETGERGRIVEGFKALGNSCGGCHDSYRVRGVAVPIARAAALAACLLPAALATPAAAQDGSAGRVERGAYLVHAAGCVTCHTREGDDAVALAGGRELDTPYGTFRTPNLTPDQRTGIGAWSQAEFVRALRHGVSPAGEPVLTRPSRIPRTPA